MKHGGALAQSMNSVRLLLVAVPATWALWYFARLWLVFWIALGLSVVLILDAVNVARIRRRARSDPAFLDRKIEGT